MKSLNKNLSSLNNTFRLQQNALGYGFGKKQTHTIEKKIN